MRRLVAILSLSALSLLAQTNRGSIAGTITDATQAVVPNAKITVTNVGTNEVRTTTSAGNGTYSVPNLDPVLYNIKVEAPGFRAEEITNVKVDTASNASVNLTLQAGAV